jgi:hypothetical protein
LLMKINNKIAVNETKVINTSLDKYRKISTQALGVWQCRQTRRKITFFPYDRKQS